jgi:hypothetical protein
VRDRWAYFHLKPEAETLNLPVVVRHATRVGPLALPGCPYPLFVHVHAWPLSGRLCGRVSGPRAPLA